MKPIYFRIFIGATHVTPRITIGSGPTLVGIVSQDSQRARALHRDVALVSESRAGEMDVTWCNVAFMGGWNQVMIYSLITHQNKLVSMIERGGIIKEAPVARWPVPSLFPNSSISVSLLQHFFSTGWTCSEKPHLLVLAVKWPASTLPVWWHTDFITYRPCRHLQAHSTYLPYFGTDAPPPKATWHAAAPWAK